MDKHLSNIGLIFYNSCKHTECLYHTIKLWFWPVQPLNIVYAAIKIIKQHHNLDIICWIDITALFMESVAIFFSTQILEEECPWYWTEHSDQIWFFFPFTHTPHNLMPSLTIRSLIRFLETFSLTFPPFFGGHRCISFQHPIHLFLFIVITSRFVVLGCPLTFFPIKH